MAEIDQLIVDNMVLNTDAYKETHWLQYPRDTEYIYSYLESRGGAFPDSVFFGLQMMLKRHLVGSRITQKHIDQADEICRKVFGQDYFNREGWEYILDRYHGALPVEICAAPEGMVVPTHNILMSVVNTDPKVPFVTNFFETFLMEVWYPITVATQSHHIKRVIKKYADVAGEQVSPFHLNDFGCRGVSSLESAGIGGAAHLVNFMGTDTLPGVLYAMKYYNTDVCGFSVLAAEHSTVTSYGKDKEEEAYRAIITACPDGGTVSIVSDSFDLMHAVRDIYGCNLKPYITSRDMKLVVRPDSGDPAEVSCMVLNQLYDDFGGHVNERGYKVLNPKVGVIYGDGINIGAIDHILDVVVNQEKFAPSNVIFGMGGALLQQIHRDTLRFAFKCSAIRRAGKWYDVYKEPKTDPSKASKRGLLALVRDGESVKTVQYPYEQFALGHPKNLLVPVFRDGNLIMDWSFQSIRERADKAMV